jgi:hypothetical protein
MSEMNTSLIKKFSVTVKKTSKWVHLDDRAPLIMIV